MAEGGYTGGELSNVDRDNETWLAHLRSHGAEQQAALRDLRKALIRRLYGALSGYRQVNDAFVEDTAQDALIRILDRLSTFEGRSRFETWATAIAIRVAWSELRRRRWRDVSLDDLLSDGSQIAPAVVESYEPELTTAQRAIVDSMYEVIHRQLTKRQRTALLAELRGMPQVEIGRHLGSNRNAVYKLTHDARKRLRRGLEDAGYRADDIGAVFTT